MSFTEIERVLRMGDNIQNFTANASVHAGQIVQLYGTGESWEVTPATGAVTKYPVGVALYGQKAAKKVAIACVGCVVKIRAHSNISAGNLVIGDNTSAGCGAAVTPTNTSIPIALTNTSIFALHTISKQVVGFALENIAAHGVGDLFVQPMVYENCSISQA